MIPETLNPEIHITTIEVKSTEIENPVNKSLTSVNIREIPKQENAVDLENNAEINNVKKQGHETSAPVTNIYRMEKVETFRKVFRRYSKGNERRSNPKRYWVQYNFAAATPEDSSPLSYDSSRNSFVAIVFAITLLMLLATAIVIGYINYSDDIHDYVKFEGKKFFFIGLGGLFMLNYLLMCSPCARMLPCNIVILVLTVVSMTMLAGYITILYSTDIIFIALVATAATVLVCFFLALTSFDFTQYLLYMIAISVAFAVVVLTVSIISLATGVKYKPATLAILIIGTIFNVTFLIMQLQAILGGKAVEVSEDDWGLAAFMLYTSIMDIFMKLLQLIGFSSMDDD